MAKFIKKILSKIQELIDSSSKYKKEENSDFAGIESDKAEMNPDKIVGSINILSDSIVSVINNMESKGPLSVCINGKWGSGKSTLINYVFRKLRKENCTCVIFNAWHHESENHLYVALIEQVRKSWIPRRVLSYPYMETDDQLDSIQILKEWIRIYSFLWFRRFFRSSLQFILFFSIVFASFVGFWYLLLHGTIIFLFEPKTLFGLEVGIINSEKLNSQMYFTLLLMSFASWIYFWYSPYNILKAFAAAPVSQVSARIPWLTFAQFAEQLGFRYRFSISFNEVCKALNSIDRKLVIIIDDIDRCNKDQILELFEAVNFLCTSGPCFVLLAMDKERVIEMLGETSKEKEYFRKYLEKIINLTVKVQTVTAEEIQLKRKKQV